MTAEAIAYRRPAEADHARLARAVEAWWSARRARPLLQRAWFRHFSGTSWLALAGDRPVGVLLGYRSQDDPSLAVLQLIAVDPTYRRRGVGRALLERFAGDLRRRGARRLEVVAWPDDRPALAFFRAADLRPDAGLGTMPLYGTPSVPHYEGDGEDRAVLRRDL